MDYCIIYVALVTSLCCSAATASYQNDSKINTAAIADGLEIATDTLDIVNGLLKISGALFPELEPITGVLGAYFGLFSLLFSAGSESAEMTYMKEQFGEVNMKLDTISQDVNQIKDLITDNTLKAAYIADEGKILNGYNQLQDFLRELQNLSCNAGSDCARERIRIASRYDQYFDINSNMQNIFRGAMDPTTVFSKPLIEQLKSSSDCNVRDIQKFTDGILKLAIKEKKVTMIHEMLSGTNYSITNRMNNWLKQMYTLKHHTDKAVSDCFKDMGKYIKKDVSDPKYQSGYPANLAAANALKHHLETKYFWLNWIVVAFDKDDDTDDYTIANGGTVFRSKGNRRKFYAFYLDKGAYDNAIRDKVFDTVDYIIEKAWVSLQFSGVGQYRYILRIDEILTRFRNKLKEQGVWKNIKSFAMLDHDKNFHQASSGNHLASFFERVFQNNDYRFFLTLKSEEELQGSHCSLSCKNGGSCRRYPFSSSSFCNCVEFFYGRECENRSNTTMASNLEAMVQQMMKIPKVVDVFFEIRDMSNFIGSSLGRIQRAISHLDRNIGKAFVKLHDDLSDQLAWVGTVTTYGDPIKSLQYFIKVFEEYKQNTAQSNQKEQMALAEAVLGAQRYNGIRRWLHDFNNLINGTSGFTLTPEDPVLIRYMTHYQSMACSQEYKNAIDNVWRQLMFLQQRGYILWIQALHILNEPSDFALRQYEDYTDSQTETLRKKTCSLVVPFSEHANCTGGYYLNEHIPVTVKCKINYFLQGSETIDCVNPNATCIACNCNVEGSSTLQCAQQTGKCTCKTNFYGTKCENRKCMWGPWGQWGACNRSCDHGMKTRQRTHAIEKRGSGSDCTGPSEKSTPCFTSCCSDQHTCSASKKCISKNQVCDNTNDCGNDEDESECCSIVHYTPNNNWGGGDSVYLDRHDINCGNDMLREFQLERPSHDIIRYRYHCCRYSKPFCSTKRKTNPATESNESLIYLDKQYVDCGSTGVLKRFHLARNSRHNQWYYEYTCCQVNSPFHITCENRETQYTYHNSDNNNVYLDRQRVACNKYEYLSYFHLERNRNHDHVRYQYRCCKVV